jgi:hypothetical protein
VVIVIPLPFSPLYANSILILNARKSAQGVLHMNFLKHALTGAAILALASPAFAELGGSVSSIASDQAYMKASLSKRATTNYSVNEMQLASGTVVREYVAAGTVFAVAWKGPTNPDLQQLLGVHYARYQNMSQNPRLIQRQTAHIDEVMGIEVGGHMLARTGHAWLVKQLPAGVSPSDIQ